MINCRDLMVLMGTGTLLVDVSFIYVMREEEGNKRELERPSISKVMVARGDRSVMVACSAQWDRNSDCWSTALQPGLLPCMARVARL